MPDDVCGASRAYWFQLDANHPGAVKFRAQQDINEKFMDYLRESAASDKPAPLENFFNRYFPENEGVTPLTSEV